MPKSNKRSQTKVKISGDGDVTFTGGDIHVGLPSNVSPARGDRADLDADISSQKGGKVDFTGGSKFHYAETNFQAALHTLEEVLVPLLKEPQVEKVHQLIADLEKERRNSAPDKNRIKELLYDVVQVVQLVALTGPAVGEVQKAIQAIALAFGISL
jgi:hypothetical protein